MMIVQKLVFLLVFLQWCQSVFGGQLRANSNPWSSSRKIDLEANCAVTDSQKVDCGFNGISQAQCLAKGCCWAAGGPGIPWCYNAGTNAPTTSPTRNPTASPTTAKPTANPTRAPTAIPTTTKPTVNPTTFAPSSTNMPTATPTTAAPTPSKAPTANPTTAAPSTSKAPTMNPTTAAPSTSRSPTASPTTAAPSISLSPTPVPSTAAPSFTHAPTVSFAPTVNATRHHNVTVVVAAAAASDSTNSTFAIVIGAVIGGVILLSALFVFFVFFNIYDKTNEKDVPKVVEQPEEKEQKIKMIDELRVFNSGYNDFNYGHPLRDDASFYSIYSKGNQSQITEVDLQNMRHSSNLPTTYEETSDDQSTDSSDQQFEGVFSTGNIQWYEGRDHGFVTP